MTPVDPNDDERGQATVELALVLVVATVTILAVAQVLAVARDANALVAATRAAAREAMLGTDATGLRSVALGEHRLDPDRLAVGVSPAPPGDYATVVLTYRVPTDVPIVGRFIGDVTLREEMVVLVE